MAGVSANAFWFDASACSGCKACQVACKDKHDLPVGVRWRRVYEVVGGGWTRRDGAWLNDVFAYNVSVACNHCERPICMEVCPASAITRRPDGLVLLDPDRCMGCRYCEWACPYGAPQYDPMRGRMGKCTFCVDELDRGGAPACVTACPQRVLDFGDRVEMEARHGPSPAMYPLPDPTLTRPASSLTPHPLAARAAEGRARVANREEVRVEEGRAMPERSLVAFSLLAQAAVGMFCALAGAWWIAGAASWARGWGPHGGLQAPLLAVGPLAVVAALVSLLHLGSPRNAWRALANLKTSWLSREILCLAVFVGGWGVLVATLGIEGGGGAGASPLVHALAAVGVVAGVGLVYGMSRVYRLRTVPAWDTPLTTATFFLASGSLGGLAARLAVGTATGAGSAPRGLVLLAAACLAVELALEPAWRSVRRRASDEVDAGLNAGQAGASRAGGLRPALLVVALALSLTGVAGRGGVVALAAALAAAGGAAIEGRATFYRSQARRGL